MSSQASRFTQPQTEEERIKSQQQRVLLRQDYRELIQKTEERKIDYTNPTSDGLVKGLKKSQYLFEKVEKAREAVLDSEFLVLSSSLALKSSRNLKHTFVEFDAAHFMAKVKGVLSENERAGDELSIDTPPQILNWETFGRSVANIFKGRAPSLDILSGALQNVNPVRQMPRRKTENQEKVTKTQPLQGAEAEITQEEATTKEVARVFKYVDELREPMCFFSFIVNPFSFVATVENIFHLAFLVKDGHAAVSLDEDTGLPIISKSVPPSESDMISSSKKQVVMRLSIAEWQAIIKEFDIQKSYISTSEENDSSSSESSDGSDGSSSEESDEEEEEDEEEDEEEEEESVPSARSTKKRRATRN